MFYREFFSALAVALTFIAFYPYLRDILRGKTKPHVFSWLIWGVTTVVVFLAQRDAQAGTGAWPIGISGLITLAIALIAYTRRADISITKTDWLFLAAALGSLPLWYVMADPLGAVVVLTLVDILGFGPTVRKVYTEPYSESLAFFALFAARNALVILALEHHSLATVLFPAAVAIACLLLMGLLVCRRRAIVVNTQS